MMRWRFLGGALLSLFLWSVAPAAHADTTKFPALIGEAETSLKIASVTDLEQFRQMIDAFQRRYPRIAVTYEESTSDNLDTVSKDACEAEDYFADLVISSSLPRQVWFVNEGCAEPLGNLAATATPTWAQWRNEIVGLTYEPAVIVYNKAALGEAEVPRDRFALIDLLRQSDRFDGRIGTYDIERSGVGYFFAFEDSEQAGTWARLMESMGRNHVELFCCTSEILERVARGDLTFGYNVLGSYALDFQQRDHRIGIILPTDYTLVLTRAAFIPKTARAKTAARLFVDFALSNEGRAILETESNFGTPAAGPAQLKELLSLNADTLRPIALNPTLLVPLDGEKRRSFVEIWRQSVAR